MQLHFSLVLMQLHFSLILCNTLIQQRVCYDDTNRFFNNGQDCST